MSTPNQFLTLYGGIFACRKCPKPSKRGPTEVQSAIPQLAVGPHGPGPQPKAEYGDPADIG